MFYIDNLKMLNCLNDTGLNKVHELLSELLENKVYTQISLEQLEKETEESIKQRSIKWETEKEEEKNKRDSKIKELKQQYKSELHILYNQPLPLNQLDLLYAIEDIEDSKAITLCNVYLWGYIQGKRDERARRKNINDKGGCNHGIN